MRKRLYSGVHLNLEKEIEIYKKAQKIIQENKGVDDLVLELSQPCVMGGVSYDLTSRKELRKDYIGYKGFLTYEVIEKHLKQLKNL